MRIKIVKCSNNDYWYKVHIGEVFEVEDAGISLENKESYRTYFSDGTAIINKDDCEMVTTD